MVRSNLIEGRMTNPNVEPSIEEKVKVITVHDSSDLKPEEVKVIPKIIEQ